jgi:hypothetical protein
MPIALELSKHREVEGQPSSIQAPFKRVGSKSAMPKRDGQQNNSFWWAIPAVKRKWAG